MKKHLKKILSFGLSLSIVLGLIATPTASTDIEIKVQSNPKIDIALTIKDTSLDLSNFEQDIRSALESEGINTSNITFQTVEGGEVSTNNMDASTIFNEWGRIGKTGNWSLVTVDGVNAIQNKENTVGMTGFYYKDNFKLKDMTLEFDARPIDGDDDYFGIFLRFNVDNESAANTSKKATTYMYIEQKNNVSDFKTKNGLFRLISKNLISEDKTSTDQSSALGGCLQQVTSGWTATTSKFNHYKFSIEGNHIIGYRDGVKIVDYVDTSTSAITTGSFGFVNWSQPAQFKNFIASYTVFKDYKDLLYNTKWREDAMHVLVNVDDNVDNTLTGTDTIGEILSRTLADDTHFIQWGTDTNKSATTNFIKQNDNKGLFTYNSNYNQAVKDTVNYIKSLIGVEEETGDQYITIGQDINLSVTPENFKTGATSTDYPNGRWKINHEYKYFANNLGQSAEAGMYSPNLNCNFDKPGKYEITFDDEIIKTIYVHRKPVADFEINIENLAIELKNVSYDLDSNNGNGIASERWYYKEASASSWTEGKLTQLDKTKIYVIKLEVEDFQGATNYTTKYVGTGNPVSNFNFANNTICKYNQLEINNTSYDPVGYDITTESWVLKKDGQVIGTYSEPILNFNTSNLGPGNYSYTLTVTNSVNTKSEAYTKSFTVVDDIAKPEISIETEVNNTWLPEKDVEVEVSDNESSVAKWRYSFVTSPTPTTTDEDWSNWDTENTKVTVNSGALSGRYYLHIQAYDSANNLTERTVGPFNLDNSNPVINGVDVEKQGFRETKVVVDAFDEHSGIVGYALTKYETATFSMRTRTFAAPELPEFQESNEFMVDEDGLYTVWAIDALGNVETSVCEVINSNQTDKTTTVYAEIGSEFKVTIPKKIVLDGATKSGTYQVTVEGDIAGLEVISVTPDSAVTLSSKDKADVIGTITQDKLNWTYSEIYTDSKILANGTISAQGITAGAWNGTFNFAIKLENNGKYTNSEWSVEYQDVTFDMEELDNSTSTEPTE